MAEARFKRQFLWLWLGTMLLLGLSYTGLWQWAIGLQAAPHIREFATAIQVAGIVHLVYVGLRQTSLRTLWTRDLGYQVVVLLGGILVVLGSQRIKAGHYPVLRALPWVVLLLIAARGLMIGVRHHFEGKRWKSGLATSIWAILSLLMVAELIFAQVAESHGSAKTLANMNWHARYGRPLNWLYASDVEHPHEHLVSKKRGILLYLGDSFAVGAGLPDFLHDRYSSRVRNLSCPQVPWTHVNLAEGGASQREEMIAYDYYLYHFDAAVVSYYINDIYPIAQAMGKAKELEPFDYQGFDFVSRFFLDHSYFLNWAFWRFPHTVETDYLGTLIDLYADQAVYQRHLVEISRLANGFEGRPMIFVMFPMLRDIPRQQAVYDQIEAHLDSPNVFVLRVDRFPALLRDPDAYIVSRNDLHPNEALHAMVADSISALIARTPRLRSALCDPATQRRKRLRVDVPVRSN